MGPHWKDGEGWMQEGNFDPTRAALPAYSQTHTQARSLKSCLKTHSSCWDTRIAENRHMSEARKELSVLKHFSFHTGEVFSNTSQGSVREKSCHREGSVWTQFTLYVWKCVGAYQPTGIFLILLVEWTLHTPNYANMGAGWLILQSITVGALYCPIGIQDWNDPFYNIEVHYCSKFWSL